MSAVVPLIVHIATKYHYPTCFRGRKFQLIQLESGENHHPPSLLACADEVIE